jgi:predicted Zn-dependent protease
MAREHHSPDATRTLSQLLWRRAVAMVVAAATAFVVPASSFAPARAQEDPGDNGPQIVRDAEIEQLLKDYTQPILRAAGLANQNVRVVIINDPQFNAFVMDGRHIFINTGALLQAETPNEVIGVLAHETGHMAGGHLAKMRQQLAQAQTQMILATLLGIGAMVAGARSNNSGAANVGMAALSAPQSAITRSLISYQRQQEESADRAGVRFLTATQQSPKGMYTTFKRFADQSLFQTRGVDPYVMSHPMPIDRVNALEVFAKASPYWDKKDDAALQLRHDLMRAKLAGFMNRVDTVARRYPTGNDSLPARYARAIATYRHGDLRTALALIDGLVQSQPANPYFYELRGQALLEGGIPKEAIPPLRKAVQLSHNAPLIEILLGQALVASDNFAVSDEAIAMLKNALIQEPEAPIGYMQLAMAYGKKGDLADADLASAQAAYLRGDLKYARGLAIRAKGRFAVGSPGWVKADDIVNAKPIPGQRQN